MDASDWQMALTINGSISLHQIHLTSIVIDAYFILFFFFAARIPNKYFVVNCKLMRDSATQNQ